MLRRLIRKLAGQRAPDKPDAELEAARALLGQNRQKEVIDRLGPYLSRRPDHAEARFLRGTALLELQHAKDALPDLERAAALNSAEPRYRYNLAVAHWLRGDAGRAIEECEAAVSSADFTPAHTLLSQIELPGDDYFTQMQRIHDCLRPRTYVEIGVFRGRSLRMAHAETFALGIDPEPQLDQPAGPRQRIFTETSDAFFAGHDVTAELGGRRVELAFIDGMHHFEYALRDFVNIERVADPDSIVLVHDCHPLDRKTSGRERQTAFWSGDIWRLILLLKKYRPELSLHVIATPPTGLAIIRHLDPASRVLAERMNKIVEEFMAVDFAVIEGRKAQMLNLYPNEWPRIEELLRSRRRG